MNQIRNEQEVLSRKNEKESSPLRFARSRRIRKLVEAESTMEERRMGSSELGRVSRSSSPGFLAGLDGAHRDLVMAR